MSHQHEDGVDDLDSQVIRLRELQPNWDSYGGAVPSEAAIAAAVKVLQSSGTLVPCSDGGVQIDWPTAEMTFRPDGSQEFDDVCAAAFKELADRHKAIFGREIAEERFVQDEEWGGPAHDDSHDETDWIPIIAKFLRRAEVAANFIGVGPENQIQFSGGDPRKAFERRMIQIAALAVAAVKASRHRSVSNHAETARSGVVKP